MKPPFLPHSPLLRIKSHVTIITCSDFQRWQLTHDALPFPAFSRALGQKESHTQLRQDASSPHLFTEAHQNAYERCLQRWIFLCRKGSFPESKTKISASKIYASKNYGFPFIIQLLLKKKKNNVQMSLMEINKMKEVLISLESTRKYNFSPKPSQVQVCWIFKLATFVC